MSKILSSISKFIDDSFTSVSKPVKSQANALACNDIYLLSILVDDSGSIQAGENSQLVRNGFNQIISDLRATNPNCKVIVTSRYLNGFALCTNCPLDSTPFLDNENYTPNGQTPLFDQSYVILKGVEGFAAEHRILGHRLRTFTVIITDGNDQHSRDMNPKDVKRVVSRLMQSGNHIVSGMGIYDGVTDFHEVFRSMGIPDQFIISTGPKKGDIREAFGTVSQSVSRSSISMVSFKDAGSARFDSSED